jgi:lipoprotein-anchoring transpeptidase ErfK/SrfK
MSRVTALATSVLVLALGLPAVAQAEVVWDGANPIFRDNPDQGYRARQNYDTSYQGYNRRYQGYDPRYQYYQAPAQGYYQGYGQGYQGYQGGYQTYQGYVDPRYRGLDQRQYPAELTGGPRPAIAPQAPDIVRFANSETKGTVIIDTEARALYYTLSPTQAYRYPISVGREGFTWTGTETISRVQEWPDWYPPAEMRQRQPGLPVKMEGGVNNPLGAKALYLGDTLYRIHGTNDPKTIGRAASSGCFRMMNENVLHLASLVDIGTTVKVVKHYSPTLAQAQAPQAQ